jgi:hypothetical protein
MSENTQNGQGLDFLSAKIPREKWKEDRENAVLTVTVDGFSAIRE